MSHGGYQQYGGNPYGGENPYGQSIGGGAGYGASNPYGGQDQNDYAHDSNYAEMGNLNGPPQQSSRVMGTDEFLARVDGAKQRIRQLTSQITEISTIHQRLLSDAGSSGANQQLEHLTSQTQILNTQIKDEIKFLETDAARTGGNPTKDSQIRNLKNSFTSELQSYQKIEAEYRERYREQIKRQIRIVNPEASEAEVNEAAQQEWGTEGIFQTALKSNRSAQANSVLGAVRARHNDIQRIEKTMSELALLFTQLNEQVVLQEDQVVKGEQQTEGVYQQAQAANTELDKGIEHIKRRNRLRRWTLFVFILIICIIALVLGLYFGLRKNNNGNNNNP
ncbi:putative snare domain-containing protein [Neofusicoccum parvum UCRNP2]|uniref:Putative snare domain-containing protein n=1 Tax=Botryosphaeria parva (strain UCR-NP2) TaxID=1287680 RepID=R1GMY9_BOTPV|nr:putative snare domain-containing protein [Neofusicoccum parvum UCRNP2]